MTTVTTKEDIATIWKVEWLISDMLKDSVLPSAYTMASEIMKLIEGDGYVRKN